MISTIVNGGLTCTCETLWGRRTAMNVGDGTVTFPRAAYIYSCSGALENPVDGDENPFRFHVTQNLMLYSGSEIGFFTVSPGALPPED